MLFSRRFLPLFACQFFSAFNDNFLKTSLVFLLLFGATEDRSALITLASAIFIAPFFFLSALGGEIADRFDKARVAQSLKFVEIAIAGIAIAGYATASLVTLFIALGGFGVIAALFGPIKYGILPDHLAREQLPTANALIEAATFIAILTGTIAGGVATKGGGNVIALSALVMTFAVLCWVSALFIPPTGSGAPDLKVRANLAASTAAMLRYLRADPRLWWGSLVISWFWLVGVVALSLLPPMTKQLVGGNEDAVTLFLIIFSVAVGIGSGLAAWIARGRILLRTTLIGALLLGVFALDLGVILMVFDAPPGLRGPWDVLSSILGSAVAINLFGLAVAGGLFIVPAFAAVQAWAGAAFRARTIAAVNILNAAFMTGSTVVVAIMQSLGATLPILFIVLGLLNLLVAVAIWRTMPRG